MPVGRERGGFLHIGKNEQQSSTVSRYSLPVYYSRPPSPPPPPPPQFPTINPPLESPLHLKSDILFQKPGFQLTRQTGRQTDRQTSPPRVASLVRLGGACEAAQLAEWWGPPGGVSELGERAGERG